MPETPFDEIKDPVENMRKTSHNSAYVLTNEPEGE